MHGTEDALIPHAHAQVLYEVHMIMMSGSYEGQGQDQGQDKGQGKGKGQGQGKGQGLGKVQGLAGSAIDH